MPPKEKKKTIQKKLLDLFNNPNPNPVPATTEIVSPTRTLGESGRRMSGDQYDYPSKKSTDGKTLYQKSLPRPQSMSSTQCVS